MIKAIIDKKMLIEKNTIQVNRLLGNKEEFELNKDTDLLFENPYLFPFGKLEKGKIIELTEEETKLMGLVNLQINEAIIDNKIVKLKVYERFENGKITTNEQLKKEYINSKILYLKSERVQLKENREKFVKFEEDTAELDIRIKEISDEIKELEG